MFSDNVLPPFSIKKLKKMIGEFYKSKNTEEKKSILKKMFFIEKQDGKKVVIIPNSCNWLKEVVVPKGATFFRVRTDSGINKSKLNSEDLWAPPKEKVSAGRLNVGQESVLYATLDDPMTALKEVSKEKNAKPSNALFIIYKANRSISANEVGAGFSSRKEIDCIDNKFRKIMVRFLNKIFNESSYEITNFIGTSICSWNNAEALCYASVIDKESINYCFSNGQPESLTMILAIHYGENDLPVKFSYYDQDGELITCSYSEKTYELFKKLFEKVKIQPQNSDFKPNDLFADEKYYFGSNDFSLLGVVQSGKKLTPIRNKERK